MRPADAYVTEFTKDVPRVKVIKAEDFMQYAEGRMKKKVMGAVEAVQAGVGRVVFADGRIAQPLHAALEGQGTVIT